MFLHALSRKISGWLVIGLIGNLEHFACGPCRCFMAVEELLHGA